MQLVFEFSENCPGGKDLLGGKGAGLAEMTRLGLPVPPGFTVTTEACRFYLRTGAFPSGLWDEIATAVTGLEAKAGRRLGGGRFPLLLSVRSGSKFSMPGMMDTVLDLGINNEVAQALARAAGDRFAWDAYRRFLQTYGKTVLEVSGDAFEAVLREQRQRRAVESDAQLDAVDLEQITRRFQVIIEESGGVPLDPVDQLQAAVVAVFESWNNRRARAYRQLNKIPEDLGTAANVQMMVYGNLDAESGTGVAFTRDPATGERKTYGDFLPFAQGEDVVAGIRTPLNLDQLADLQPSLHAELVGMMEQLEKHYRDMCDIEFTIESNKLYLLQTRIGKRTVHAAVRMAVEMANEGLIDRQQAVLRVDPDSLDQLLHPQLPDDLTQPPLAKGVEASPGAARGGVVFTADRAVEVAATGQPVILVRWETTPEDIHGMAAAAGILTSHGGKTSHAAVVARGMGKPAVTGVNELVVDEEAGQLRIGDLVLTEGDALTIDGTTGTVFAGTLPLVEPQPRPELTTLLGWADEFRRLGVRANADTGSDARRARQWGAEGIGLARTEHMFLGERLPVVRQLILEEDPTRRWQAQAMLRDLQTADFEDLLEAMDGLPVIVRLLDPPLHEFLPDLDSLQREIDERTAGGESVEELLARMRVIANYQETNPMLGMRGVRLGLVRPDIYRTQVQAAMEAMARRIQAGGDPHLELMVPLVATSEELRRVRVMISEEVQAAQARTARSLDVKIGTMIELPRAALAAGEIAAEADFFSFGTNDLTQTTFGLSRDDAETSFLPRYLETGVLLTNPFATLDREGVGRLVELSTREGKAANPGLEVGICGEHGGDPASILFCHTAGLDYVSCSPFRIPTARLAAAHAALGGGRTAAST